MRKLTPEEQNSLPSWYDAEHIAWLNRHERRQLVQTRISLAIMLLSGAAIVFIVLLQHVRP